MTTLEIKDLHVSITAETEADEIPILRGVDLTVRSGETLGVWLMWRNWRELWLAAIGGTLLGAYVVIRAARFNNVHTLVGDTYLARVYRLLDWANVGSKATVARAKERLGVETRKSKFGGGWEWRLPQP